MKIASFRGLLAVLCSALALGALGCSKRAPCPSPGDIAAHPQDFDVRSLRGVNVVDCVLVGRTARSGDMAVAIPPAGEGVTVSGTPDDDGSSPGRLTVTTSASGVLSYELSQ